eukprot:3800142-Pleurochrysis_carterae.AAC.1
MPVSGMLPSRFESARMHAHRAEQPRISASAQLVTSLLRVPVPAWSNTSTGERGRLCVNPLHPYPTPRPCTCTRVGCKL